MSDGQWDADDFKPPDFKAALVSDKWEGEDEDDDVKDNWDDEDDAEQEQKKEPESDGVKAVQVKKKGTLKSKLKEKEEERKREKEEEQRKKQEAAALVLSNEEIFEEKLRRQKLQEEADLELAKEAFGVANDVAKSGIDSIEPSNKEEFDLLKKALVDKLTKYERTSLYLPFLDDLFRELCVNLEADDIKKLGSTLNAVSTEKAKVAKASKTKKKAGSSKKASLVVGKASDFDYADYGGGDEYEDFM